VEQETATAKEKAPGCHEFLADCEATAGRIENVLGGVLPAPSDQNIPEPAGMCDRLRSLRTQLGNILDHATAIQDTLGTSL
jgi:hypothetical protein